MRVIAGSAKGHKLVAPKSDLTRPVLGQVKEAIFNILYNVEGERVLDLFAGSGAVGIEALSRGAAHCIFVEYAKPAVACTHRNLHRCHLLEHATVFHLRVSAAIKKLNGASTSFDLIFVDPPYEQGLVKKTLDQLSTSNLLASDGRIIVEHHPHEPIGDIAGFALTDTRRYGQTHVSFLKRS